ATNDEVIDITYKRMKNISENIPMNLKYFNTDFIDKNAENLENSLLNNVKTLIELKHGIDLNDSNIAIVTKRRDMDELDLDNLSTIYMRSQTHKMLDRNQLE
ncbi:site-specific DNA-methyltransferase, partial [Enterococcus faecalis]|nr:site-specific DNA-methyltransferase [Enterococcus faecalis]